MLHLSLDLEPITRENYKRKSSNDIKNMLKTDKNIFGDITLIFLISNCNKISTSQKTRTDIVNVSVTCLKKGLDYSV